MPNEKAIPHLTWVQKFLWWCSGINVELLSEVKSEWQKFYAIGLTILSSGVFAAFSMAVASNFIFRNIYLSISFGLIWGLLFLFINKIFVLNFRDNTKRENLILFLFRISLSISITIVVSYPVLFVIFKESINEHLQAAGKVFTPGILANVNAFQELKNENLTIAIFSWVITIFIFLIDSLPITLAWLSPKGIYERSLNLSKDNQRIAIELYAKEKYEQLEDIFKKKSQKREGTEIIPFGGFEVYIDYKSLRLEEINSLFSRLNDVYYSIYKIEAFNTIEEIVSEKPNYNFHDLFKSHPEDNLIIHSIETGNSITFKIATGWKPKIELIKGDFTVYLPKGSIALLLTGYLISKMFDYGISTYKELLEIKKLNKEIQREQIENFNSKLNVAPVEVKEEFQRNLYRFYDTTMANSNFIQIKITRDQVIVEKIEKGELSISNDEK